jgi:hypothetical protein
LCLRVAPGSGCAAGALACFLAVLASLAFVFNLALVDPLSDLADAAEDAEADAARAGRDDDDDDDEKTGFLRARRNAAQQSGGVGITGGYSVDPSFTVMQLSR